MSGLWDRRGVKYLTVHHLGNGKPPLESEMELVHDANPRGYDYPEYEYGILANGSIVPMRPLTVVGAHTVADYEKYQHGKNWWNRNSASVVIANDCTIYPPTPAQVDALINFCVDWCRRQGANFDYIYPHFQLSRTACPGAISSQLGLHTGYLNWDMVNQRLAGVSFAAPIVTVESSFVPEFLNNDTLKEWEKLPVVIYLGNDDKTMAERLAAKLSGVVCPRVLTKVWGQFPSKVVVGGEEIPGATNYCGVDYKDTCMKVLSVL